VADLVLPVPNRQLDEVCDTSLPIHQALAQLTEKTRDAIGHLLDALADPSCIGLQLDELRHALLDAGRGAFGVGSGRGERRVEIALRDICANSFLNPESCQRASAAILHLRGGKDLSLQEINGATGLVGHLVGDVAIEACLSADEDAGDGVRALLLITGVRPSHADVTNEDAASASQPHQDLSFHDGVNLDIPAYLRRRTSYRVKR
jgi:cell division protein FtsZ